jgi:hypothetical protein
MQPSLEEYSVLVIAQRESIAATRSRDGPRRVMRDIVQHAAEIA